MLRRREYVTDADLRRALQPIEERLDLMATQADVDAITAQVTQVAADLAGASTKLQAEIDSLAAANPSIDLTALQAEVAPLDAAAQALGNLVPDAPAPPAS